MYRGSLYLKLTVATPVIVLFTFCSLGEFSRFYIQSVTSDGRLKRTGGDSWRVHIRQGPASLAPMVVDHDDGTYEVMFLALEPGNYSTQVFLDYTLCDGYRDPPADWYIKGVNFTVYICTFLCFVVGIYL